MADMLSLQTSFVYCLTETCCVLIRKRMAYFCIQTDRKPLNEAGELRYTNIYKVNEEPA